MKLAISNIAWSAENDKKVFELMKKYGFKGLEIAPTRIFPVNPYDNIENAHKWFERLLAEYGFEVPSMQSIWYGKSENIFHSDNDRSALLEYTKKAIHFAVAADCKNLVFGCPKNRNMSEASNVSNAVNFFVQIGSCAAEKGTIIGMEANPPIYGTNYINTTAQALELIEKVNNEGFLLNLDVGTMIFNNESTDIIRGRTSLINHVHISEPHLKSIEERPLHKELLKLLAHEGYKGYISIEMGRQDDISAIEKAMKYLKGLTE